MYDSAEVATARTSIYIGAVTLKSSAFIRQGARYTATYQAKVFPFFFYNESGEIWIELPDDDLRRLAEGERVEFSGEAHDRSGELRRVTGHAEPVNPESGEIKVRVWVSKKIQLIFNTTYRFTGSD